MVSHTTHNARIDNHVLQYQSVLSVVIFIVISVLSVSNAVSGSPIQSQSQPKLTWSKLTRSFTSNITKTKSTDWDFLILSLSWPQTFCTKSSDNHVACEVPSDVNDTVIHGLWPSKTDSSQGPFNCNSSWKFDFNQVQDLESRLLVEWPNVLVKQSETSLWKHEWEKHGTCAASLPSLNSQHNYFGQTLDLKLTYDLLKMLQPYGIIPSSDKQYQYDNVVNTLTEVLTQAPDLECYIPLEKTSVFYIAEFRICLNKDFKVIGCGDVSIDYAMDLLKGMPKDKLGNREYQPCSSNLPLMIPPITHDTDTK